MKKTRTRAKQKFVIIRAVDLKPPTRAEMRRLKAAMNDPVDTSDIPEITEEDIRSGKLKPVSPNLLKKRKRGRVA